MSSDSDSWEMLVLTLTEGIETCALQGLRVEPPPRQSRCRVYIVFTDLKGSAAALEVAAELTANLEIDLAMVAVQTVPFVLPLSDPPVSLDFKMCQLRDLIKSTGLQVQATIYLCRDDTETLLRILPPAALVVMGMKKSRLPSRAKYLAGVLERHSHQVLRVTYY